MKEGKLLGHIISKEGVVIDAKRVLAFQVTNLPRNKKDIQSFLGKLIFLRRFIPNYVLIVKYITNMLKKDHKIKWTIQARYYFS